MVGFHPTYILNVYTGTGRCREIPCDGVGGWNVGLVRDRVVLLCPEPPSTSPEGAALGKESEREDGLGDTHGHHPVGIVPLVLAPGLGELPDLAHLAVWVEVGAERQNDHMGEGG